MPRFLRSLQRVAISGILSVNHRSVATKCRETDIRRLVGLFSGYRLSVSLSRFSTPCRNWSDYTEGIGG
nr:MAG TPA: hypothetical protein [Bacteriophage sp.]